MATPNDAPEQTSATAEASDDKMELILDIPVLVTVEIGRTKMTIRNLLQLNQGGVYCFR